MLARPDTGVVLAFPVGRFAVALRLPEAAREEALKSGALREWQFTGGSMLYVSDIGDEWVIASIGWLRDQEVAWLRRAFDYAGEDKATRYS